MVALACPRRSETTFTGTPSASSRVACVAQVVQPDRQSLLPTVGGIFEQLRELAEYGSGLARSLARAGVMTALRAREAVLKGRLCVGARSSCGRCRRHGLRRRAFPSHTRPPGRLRAPSRRRTPLSSLWIRWDWNPSDPHAARAAGWGSAGSAEVHTYRSAASNVWKEPPRTAVNAVLWPPRWHQHRALECSAAPLACRPGEPHRDAPELGRAPWPQSALGWLMTAGAGLSVRPCAARRQRRCRYPCRPDAPPSR